MNPLGFRSAIYQLADTTSIAMGDVAGQLAQVARSRTMQAAGGDATAAISTRGETFASGVLAARDEYGLAIRAATSGTESSAELAGRFSSLAQLLDGVGSIGVSGAPQGHVRTAMHAAKDVGARIERGAVAADGAIDEATHMQLWSLRHSLDEAWNSIGFEHVMGRLR
jgi:hypothetical protein